MSRVAKPKPKWNRENIRALLERSDEAVVRGMLRIFEYQTAEEQMDGVTVEDNGVGFNGLDSEFLSNLVVFHKHHGYLTPGQMVHARKKMMKYAGQLARIANADALMKEANGTR